MVKSEQGRYLDVFLKESLEKCIKKHPGTCKYSSKILLRHFWRNSRTNPWSEFLHEILNSRYNTWKFLDWFMQNVLNELFAEFLKELIRESLWNFLRNKGFVKESLAVFLKIYRKHTLRNFWSTPKSPQNFLKTAW